MHAGSPLSYWIWHDETGNGWHLRTTTAGLQHRFSGRVWADAPLADVKPSALEIDDRLKKEEGDRVVAFDFDTMGVIDGFDFQLPGKCVTFHLLVDGKPAPKSVEIGRKEVSVGSATFRLCR
jgi:hypothetical protein